MDWISTALPIPHAGTGRVAIFYLFFGVFFYILHAYTPPFAKTVRRFQSYANPLLSSVGFRFDGRLSPALFVMVKRIFPALLCMKLLTGWPNPEHTSWTLRHVFNCSSFGRAEKTSALSLDVVLCATGSLLGTLFSVEEEIPLPFAPSLGAMGITRQTALVWRYLGLYVAQYSVLLFLCLLLALIYEAMICLIYHRAIVKWRLAKIEENRTSREFAGSLMRKMVVCSISRFNRVFRNDSVRKVLKVYHPRFSWKDENPTLPALILSGNVLPHMNAFVSSSTKDRTAGERCYSRPVRESYHLKLARTVLFPITAILFDVYVSFRFVKRFMLWWDIHYAVIGFRINPVELDRGLPMEQLGTGLAGEVLLLLCVELVSLVVIAYVARAFITTSAFTYANALPGAFLLSHAATVDDSKHDCCFALRVHGMDVLRRLTEENTEDFFVASVCKGRQNVPSELLSTGAVLPSVSLLRRLLDAIARDREITPPMWNVSSHAQNQETANAFSEAFLALIIQERIRHHYFARALPWLFTPVDPFIAHENDLVRRACAAGCDRIVTELLAIQSATLVPSSTRRSNTPDTHISDWIDTCLERGQFRCLIVLADALKLSKIDFCRFTSSHNIRWTSLLRNGNFQRFDNLSCLVRRAFHNRCHFSEQSAARKTLQDLLRCGLDVLRLLPVTTTALVEDTVKLHDAGLSLQEQHRVLLDAFFAAEADAQRNCPSSAFSLLILHGLSVRDTDTRGRTLMHLVIQDPMSFCSMMDAATFSSAFVEWALTAHI